MGHPLIPGRPWTEYDTVHRRVRFAELAAAGYATPRNGPFSMLKRLGVPLVVYVNPNSHCGRGKTLWRPGDGPVTPDTWCSAFVGDPDVRPARSLRHLFIGPHWFTGTYVSHESWMSNVEGDFSFSEQSFRRPETCLLPYGVCAVDVVLGGNGAAAVDLNVCPGIPMEIINRHGRQQLAADLIAWEESR